MGEYVALLDRRFAALSAAARGEPATRMAVGLGRRERALARRVLRTLEARWHDGDENLVRGTLDAWLARGEATPVEAARRILAAGEELLRIHARAEAWWFYLWEMESLLPLVAAGADC